MFELAEVISRVKSVARQPPCHHYQWRRNGRSGRRYAGRLAWHARAAGTEDARRARRRAAANLVPWQPCRHYRGCRPGPLPRRHRGSDARQEYGRDAGDERADRAGLIRGCRESDGGGRDGGPEARSDETGPGKLAPAQQVGRGEAPFQGSENTGLRDAGRRRPGHYSTRPLRRRPGRTDADAAAFPAEMHFNYDAVEADIALVLKEGRKLMTEPEAKTVLEAYAIIEVRLYVVLPQVRSCR